MTTRQNFQRVMRARRQHRRGSIEHQYLTRAARKLAWIALGIPTNEWSE